jgi:hypothetical protein
VKALAGWGGWLLVAVITVAQLPLLPRLLPTYQLAIISLATAAQLLPILAIANLPRPVPRARFWIGWWAAAFFISDASQLFISSVARQENLWFFLFANPLEDAALLMAYSYWQLRPLMRISFRVAIPLLAVVTLAIALAFGETHTFKSASAPFRLLLITTAVAYTLVVRTAREDSRIWERDWLWTSLGVILYYAAFVVVDPVSAALLPERADLARLVFVVKGAVDTVAITMVWIGMRCPVEAPQRSELLSG